MEDYCAAIDFGTNTARLLIALQSSGGLIPVRIEREIVRIGGGFSDLYGLSIEAQERGLSCLQRFSKLILDYGVKQFRASATSAVRDAVNGRDFVEKVFKSTGIRLVVLDGAMEARLTLNGVLSGLVSKCDKHVVLDVGGGSTEFIVSYLGAPIFIKSMPIGVVRLTEGFSSCIEMAGRIDFVLDQLERDLILAGITSFDDVELIGTAGTATTIAAINLKMDTYDYKKINNYSVERREIAEIYQQVIKLTPEERLAISGLEKGREDLIVAGMLLTTSVMDRFCFNRLKVSDFGLLEGLALYKGELPEY